jgi:general secretion pathway protein J
MRRRAQAGFTLMELMIAITLVAAISAGLLTSMRNGLLTMERIQQRLEENRKALGIQDLIRRQIGGAMPATGSCGPGRVGRSTIFRGNGAGMLMVSNESMAEGARGYPRIALYQVQPNPDGTVRLEVREQLFSGPGSTAGFCESDPTIVHALGEPLVLYARLAYCRFAYRNLNQNTLFGREWTDVWVQPLLPYAVRIEMEAAQDSGARMPVGSLTIPIRVSRTPGDQYFDEY